jgi:hypothetical protein
LSPDVQWEQWTAVRLFNQALDGSADEPSHLDTLLLRQAFQLHLLRAGQRRGHAFRVSSFLTQRPNLAAFRSIPLQIAACRIAWKCASVRQSWL